MTEPNAGETACPYCGRGFPDDAGVERHVDELKRAGMLVEHKQIHGKGGDAFGEWNLDVNFEDVTTPHRSSADGQLPRWVESLLGRGRE